MNSLDSAASPSTPASGTASRTCCRRPMTSIEVTSPLAAGASKLALHTCSGCGRHEWERDGQALDRDAVLGVVRDRIAEGPAPRLPRQRSRKKAAPAPVEAQVVPADVRARLARFQVHGR